MSTSMAIDTPTKLQPTLNINSTASTPMSKLQEPRSSITLADEHEETDFNPFCTAKPCSPFYLYNHDSPRTSTDQRLQLPKKLTSIHVSVHDLDLEKGNSNTSSLSRRPTSQDKDCNGNNGILRLWTAGGQKQCMTKPKQTGWKVWMASLTKMQRLAVKLAIALLLIGAIVGIAVGISVRVHGGVYSGANSQSSIGS